MWRVVVVVMMLAGAQRGFACDVRYNSNCRVTFTGGVGLPTNQSRCTEATVPTTPPATGYQQIYCKAGVGLCTMDSTGTEHCPGGGAGGGGYQTFMSNGTALTSRTTANFIGIPAGAMSCVDNAGAARTDCTVTINSSTINGIAAGGDLGGTYVNPKVQGLQSQPIIGTPPYAGGALLVSDGFSEWSAGNVTGDWTLSGTKVASLATFGPGAVTVGDATHVPVVTTDAKGRVSALTSTPITAGASSFATLLGGTNTNQSMICNGTCAMSGNITAGALAATVGCSTNTYANGINTAGTMSCAQVSVPQLAPATSAQLAGVLTDESGVGPAIFQSSATLINPTISTTGLVNTSLDWTDQTSTLANPATGFVRVYARADRLCSLNTAGVEACGLGGGVAGPTPPVVANSIATFNGTGGGLLQASPCTIDPTGIEDCPQPPLTTQGSIILKEGQSYGVPGNTWALTLAPGALASNFVCAIDVTTGGIPGSCLDTVPITSGGTGQTTATAAFNALAPAGLKGSIVVNNGSSWTTQSAGSNGFCIGYNSSVASGLAPTACSGGALPGVQNASTSSWNCSATTGGIFVDSDCNVVCACNQSNAKFCRSDTGVCFAGAAANDCCLATTTTTTTTGAGTTTTTSSTTTTTTSTTTTTTSGGIVNWVPLMWAFWSLDESAGTTRADTADSHNLAESASTPNDTTNKMQGTASAVFSSSHLVNNDLLPAAPITIGCWLRETDTSGGFGTFPFGVNSFANGGINMVYDDANKRYTCEVQSAANVTTACSVGGSNTATNTFTHVAMVVNSANTQVCQYINGQANGGCGTGTAIYGNVGGFALGLVASGQFLGNVDECFIYSGAMTATDLCRICSCGVAGEKCTCSGTAYTNAGRQTSNCNNCTLPACNAATP